MRPVDVWRTERRSAVVGVAVESPTPTPVYVYSELSVHMWVYGRSVCGMQWGVCFVFLLFWEILVLHHHILIPRDGPKEKEDTRQKEAE